MVGIRRGESCWGAGYLIGGLRNNSILSDLRARTVECRARSPHVALRLSIARMQGRPLRIVGVTRILPQAWGALRCRAFRIRGNRPIPTYVGAPRALRLQPLPSGPSPRAWGARTLLALEPFEDRTIPTCVGSTRAGRTRRSVSSDHPHVRGEHRSTPWAASLPYGPSPRAWGARRHPYRREDLRRTIPTCVGSTGAVARAASRCRDHPHVRGEHGPGRRCGRRGRGPSPRAWGARHDHRCQRCARRTIPTCVGSTCGRSARSGSGTDHPHVRGEHQFMACQLKTVPGPSPRAWGAHFLTWASTGR